MDGELKNILVKILESQEEMKADISKLGMKIDGEITDKLKILAEESSIMRADIKEIKGKLNVHDEILHDIKLSAGLLNKDQKRQDSKIIEIDRKLVK